MIIFLAVTSRPREAVGRNGPDYSSTRVQNVNAELPRDGKQLGDGYHNEDMCVLPSERMISSLNEPPYTALVLLN